MFYREDLMSFFNGIMLFSVIMLLQYFIITVLRHYAITVYHYHRHLLNLLPVDLYKQMLTYASLYSPD